MANNPPPGRRGRRRPHIYGKEWLSLAKRAGRRQGWERAQVTDSQPTIQAILEAVTDRNAIEQVFRDVKEVHGAGQQQLRNYHANVAA